MTKKTGLILGPIFFLIIFFLPFEILGNEADNVLAVAAWMVIWWITEAVSISVTSLIPLAFFPFLNIMEIKDVAANYGSPIVFLFFGGFVMALALEKVNLHKRIALTIIKITGTSANRVILGFMIATAFLSMWISNTATAVVMLPIGLSVIDLLINDEDGFTKSDKNFSIALMLSIAFSANVGGVATIIGTPPNTVMVGFMEQQYDADISFLRWMMLGIPFTLIMIVMIYFVLVKFVYPNKLGQRADLAHIIDEKYAELGPVKATEKRVLIIFIVTMLLWILRRPLNDILPNLTLTDAGISLLAAFALFAIPFRFNKGEFILEWEDTIKLPWGILILFGGGLALAKAMAEAGIIDTIGQIVASNPNLSVIAVGCLLIAVMLFMTELMSNVALVAIFVPVVAGIAIGLEQEILHLVIPVTISSSCAFMLPMATPPNAIVFASGYIQVHEMAKAGIILNLISILIIISFMIFIVPVIF